MSDAIIKNSQLGDTLYISKMALRTFHAPKDTEELIRTGQEIYEQAVAETKKMREDARNEADTIMGKAQIKAEELKIAAREEGYKQGIQDGIKKIENDFDKATGAIQHIKTAVDKNIGDVFHSVENQTIDLIVEIAKKIVGYEVQFNKKVVLDVVSKCLEKTKEKNHITIKVNPNDLDMVEEKKEFFLKKVRGLKEISIVESEMVLEGGCIIETSCGDVNGDLDEQFAKIKDQLKE